MRILSISHATRIRILNLSFLGTDSHKIWEAVLKFLSRLRFSISPLAIYRLYHLAKGFCVEIPWHNACMTWLLWYIVLALVIYVVLAEHSFEGDLTWIAVIAWPVTWLLAIVVSVTLWICDRKQRKQPRPVLVGVYPELDSNWWNSDF